MKDSTLLNIAFITTAIGIGALFFIMIFSDVPLREASSLNSSDAGKYVKIYGVPQNIKHTGASTSFNLMYDCSMNVVTFENISITQNTVLITGTYQEIEGRKSIIADKIVYTK